MAKEDLRSRACVWEEDAEYLRGRIAKGSSDIYRRAASRRVGTTEMKYSRTLSEAVKVKEALLDSFGLPDQSLTNLEAYLDYRPDYPAGLH